MEKCSQKNEETAGQNMDYPGNRGHAKAFETFICVFVPKKLGKMNWKFRKIHVFFGKTGRD